MTMMQLVTSDWLSIWGWNAELQELDTDQLEQFFQEVAGEDPVSITDNGA
jgi:hypothetical protein